MDLTCCQAGIFEVACFLTLPLAGGSDAVAVEEGPSPGLIARLSRRKSDISQFMFTPFSCLMKLLFDPCSQAPAWEHLSSKLCFGDMQPQTGVWVRELRTNCLLK